MPKTYLDLDRRKKSNYIKYMRKNHRYFEMVAGEKYTKKSLNILVEEMFPGRKQ